MLHSEHQPFQTGGWQAMAHILWHCLASDSPHMLSNWQSLPNMWPCHIRLSEHVVPVVTIQFIRVTYGKVGYLDAC
jgi:hypothetical protein